MKAIHLLFLCLEFTWAVPHHRIASSSINNRIINGEVASKGQFPWQVAVIATSGLGNSFCGGSLISNTWVLTAAHCAENARAFTLYLGTNTLTPDLGSTTVTSTKAIVHPDWNPVTVENDIAVIELPLPVTFNAYIKPIDLATELLTPGTDVTVSGWGKIKDSTSGVVVDLNFVGLNVIGNEACAVYYGDVHPGIVCASHISSTVQGTCSGDSGGPLVTEPESINPIQVGIVSFVSTRGCESGYPSGYARTAYYRNWIKQTTGV